MSVCAVLAGVSAASCSAGNVGRLMPDAAQGVERVAGEVAGDTARIERDGLVARVRGAWAQEGLQTISVRYDNGASSTLQLPIRGFALTHRGEAAQLVRVSDTTGVSVADRNPSNDEVDTLLDVDRTDHKVRDLVLAPGASRTVLVFFANLQREGNRPEAGSALTVTIPMPAALVPLRFRCAD